MKKILFIMMCCAFAALNLRAQGIQFEQGLTWQQILAKAKIENKNIFLDAFTTWCKPCRMMSAQTFPSKELGDLMNDHFISVKIQMDQTKNDSDFIKSSYAVAQTLSKQYGINAYPTMLFFSPDGKLMHRTVGFKDATGMIEEVKNGLSVGKKYHSLLERYAKGGLDTAAIKTLVLQAEELGDKGNVGKVMSYYAGKLDQAAFFQKENLLFLGRFLNNSKDPTFKIFLKEANKVNEIVAEKYFAEQTVKRVVYGEVIEPFEQTAEPDWKKIEKVVIAKYGVLGKEEVLGRQMIYYRSKRDWTNFGKYYKLYYEQAILNGNNFSNLRSINNISWTVVEHISDPVILETGLKAMKIAISDKDNNASYMIIDTYANLLYKAGKKEEAIIWEEKAVKLSNAGKIFVETLEKMKQGKMIWTENK